MFDPLIKKIYNFSDRKDDLAFSKIYLPPDAHSNFERRQHLWEQVKLVEKRSDANEGFTMTVALPNELSEQENMAIIDKLAAYLTKKLAVDANFHTNDVNNLHVHLQVTKREVGLCGF